jgi:hypothetical protein
VSSFATLFSCPGGEGMVLPSADELDEARRLCGWVCAEVSRRMPEPIRSAAAGILEARRSTLAGHSKILPRSPAP